MYLFDEGGKDDMMARTLVAEASYKMNAFFEAATLFTLFSWSRFCSSFASHISRSFKIFLILRS